MEGTVASGQLLTTPIGCGSERREFLDGPCAGTCLLTVNGLALTPRQPPPAQWQ